MEQQVNGYRRCFIGAISMTDNNNFLKTMARYSEQRRQEASENYSMSELERMIEHNSDLGKTMRITWSSFGVIAEVKRRSPALGALNQRALELSDRVNRYATGGASAISVLTEPSRFEGTLADLQEATDYAGQVPVMRKDFIVDPYQIVEGRLYGASGALLIVRMLSPEVLKNCLAVAQAHQMFVLLECFDEADVAALTPVLSNWKEPTEQCLIGVNSRNLVTLQVDPMQLERLSALLPHDFPKVAESGLETGQDAKRLAALGYDLALVGTALMRAEQPEDLLTEMIEQGRQGVQARP
jgi:indole-3-glycerol phosphate synthase